MIVFNESPNTAGDGARAPPKYKMPWRRQFLNCRRRASRAE